MTDLEGAYNDALNAEGSALKENEAYLDSIQGRIDLFNNSVQTMWMNTIESETVKKFVNIGTGLIDFIDKLGLIQTLITGIFTYVTAFSKHKLDFASILGIHKLDESFLKGFSAFGTQGFTGWIANLFKSKKKNNIVNTILGDPGDIKVSVADFADAIRDNINDYVTIDTSQIDSEISSVQEKLTIARQQLDTARKADWNYYKSLGSLYPAKDRDNRIAEQRQQIKTLEADLARLQAKRDNIISSAVNNTAASMVGAINNETQAYKSMLSVLDQVKGAKLYLGNEQDAAIKIDAMSAAAKNGQADLVNYVSTLGDADIALKAYAASVKDGNYSLAGFQQFIQQHNAEIKASGAAARIAAVGHQLLNAALSIGISLLASAFISLVMDAVNAEEKAAEAAKEAADASKKLREQADSLEDYKEQIRELRKELDNNTLSESDAYDVREKLLTIQNDLIEKFGLEKDGINLVTGAINDQIAAIDELSQKNAQQWLNTNQKSINEAIEFFDSDTKGGSLDPWYETPGTRIDMWGQTQNVIDMIDEYTSDHDHIFSNQGALIPRDQSISFTGSVEEVKTAVEDFQNWLSDKENELQKEKEDLLSLPDQTDDVKTQIANIEKDIEQLQDVREDIGTEYVNWFGENSTYAANKSVIEETQYNTALTQYTDQYKKILQAQNDLEEAQLKGDQDGISAALATLNAETATAAASAETNGQSYMVSFFNGIQSEYAKLSNELKFESDLANNANILVDDTTNYYRKLPVVLSEVLSDLDGMNAKEILQLGEIDPNNAAFMSLKTMAESYEMTIEDLCNTLVKLGYIQSGFTEEIENIGDTFDTYSSLVSKIESYNDILSQTDEIITDNTEVTEDYKDALIDLIGSGEKVNECFYDENKLVVKNAAALKKLVAESRKTQQANIKVAKSQAQLQYQELVQQMRRSVVTMMAQASAYDFIADITRENISVMEDQLETLEQTIQQYALLELSLSDAANAFNEYEKAKERDAEMTYDDSFLEMLKTIDEGILNNETGTEAFEYAVKAIVPEEFWKDIDDVDEKIKSIHDYIDGNPVFARLFHVDKESGELDINADNVREFVDMGMQKNENGISVFEGDSTDFSLSDDIEGIEDVAEFYGITEAAALAMLTALEKVDAKWGDILTQITMSPFDRKVHATVQEIANANNELATAQQNLADGTITLEEYEKIAKEYGEKTAAANQDLDKYTQEAKSRLLGSDNGTEDTSDDTLGFIEVNKKVVAAQEEVEKSTEELVKAQEAYNEAKADGVNDEELQKYQEDINVATENVNKHTEAWAKLVDERGEYPSEYEISLVIADIDKEIEAVGTKFDSVLSKYFKQDADGIWEVDTIVHPDVNLDDLDKEYPGIKDYINLLNTKAEIQAFADTTSAEEDANKLKDTVDGVIAAIEENLITLDLDEEAVNNIVAQANKILSGIGSNLSIDLSYTLPGTDTTISIGTVGANISTGNQGDGASNALGSAGLAHSENNTVVGEIGPELVCDPIKGVYYTVGEHGTEMVDLPKGAIIYNHKQTEELLKNGHTTRGHYTGGLSFAKGNAHAYELGIPSYHPNTEDSTSFKNGLAVNTAWDDATSTLNDAADSIGEFEETMDWIAIRMEEYGERIEQLSAELENEVGYVNQNKKIQDIIDVNNLKLPELQLAADYYNNKAESYLVGLSTELANAARYGEIAISEYTKEEEDEKTVEAINKYRDKH